MFIFCDTNNNTGGYMKANIKYSLFCYEEEIDLSDYGIEENRTWDDLTEEEKIEIKDSLIEQKYIQVSGSKQD